jgi:VanZ family protein
MSSDTIDAAWVRGGCVAAAFFMAVTLFAGAEKAAEMPLFPPPFDKATHFVYFGLMAGLLSHGVGVRWLLVPLLLVPLIGALDEWHQSTIVGRDASFFDWLADELGTLFFVCAYWRWRRRTTQSE